MPLNKHSYEMITNHEEDTKKFARIGMGEMVESSAFIKHENVKYLVNKRDLNGNDHFT